MLCVPVYAATMDEALDLLLDIPPEADLIELRLDPMADPDLPTLLAAAPCPAIVTCRPPRQGGVWDGSETSRLALLREAIEEGADYVDIEADAFHEIPPGGTTKRIASFHDFDGVPDDLEDRVRALEALPCDLVKFACMPRTLSEAVRILHALRACTKPAIGIGMGEYGEITRILAPAFGGVLTFGSIRQGTESAPGQLTTHELKHLYRVDALTPDTPLYGVVGTPIAHSMSPAIHNAALQACGLPGVYLRFHAEDFPVFLREVAEPLGVRGLSVTLPHKEAALAACESVDAPAGDIGAVNTLTRTPTGWHGCNTDCHAACKAIQAAAARAGIPLQGARALVLGAGGTARALAYGLREAGCSLTLANRTLANAEALAAKMGARAIPLADATGASCDILANTTRVGMHPDGDATPLPGAPFRAGMVVFDAVYNPRETRFLREARAAGAEIADGVEMFVGQAVEQFERWTGQTAPRDVMEEVVLQRLPGRG